MLKFTKAVELWQIGTLMPVMNSDKWIVVQSFCWWLNYDTKNNIQVVPEWFETDLGSIPWFLTWYVDRSDFIAFILHDYMRKHQHKFFTTEQIDSFLYDAVLVEWASNRKAKLIYRWVRIWAFFWIWIYNKK